jgi:hypothetical protein
MRALLTFEANAILTRAHALIGEPSSWTRGAMARDLRGRPVEFESSRAVRFCVAGALLRAAHDLGVPEARDAYVNTPSGTAVHLTSTSVAAALLAAGSVGEKAFWEDLLSDEIRAWAANSPEIAVLSIAAQLLQLDRTLEPFGTPRRTLLPHLVIEANDGRPASHPRTLRALQRGLAALEVAMRPMLRQEAASSPAEADDEQGAR